MSVEIREALAEACNTVDGVNVTPYYVQDISAGSGVVRFGGMNRPNRLGGVVTWQVVLFLPRDIAEAEAWIDTNLPLVLDAITQRRELHDALSVEPQQINIDASNVPVVVIQGTREEA